MARSGCGTSTSSSWMTASVPRRRPVLLDLRRRDLDRSRRPVRATQARCPQREGPALLHRRTRSRRRSATRPLRTSAVAVHRSQRQGRRARARRAPRHSRLLGQRRTLSRGLAPHSDLALTADVVSGNESLRYLAQFFADSVTVCAHLQIFLSDPAAQRIESSRSVRSRLTGLYAPNRPHGNGTRARVAADRL